MAKKFPLLSPAPVKPSTGPFGPMGGIKKPRKIFKKGGKVPGFFLGSLFSGTPATSSQETHSNTSSSGTSSNQIDDPEYNALRKDVLTGAADLDFSDPSKWFSPYNADQTGAFGGVRSNQGIQNANYANAQGDLSQASAADPTRAGMGYMNKAGDLQTGTEAANPFMQDASQTSAQVAGNYMQPYQQQAMGAVADANSRAFTQQGGALSRISDQFSGGNAAQFGREAHGNAVGNAVYGNSQALNQQLAQMANTGWQSGLTASAGDLNRQAQLAQTSGQLANQDIQTQQNLGTAAGNLTAQGAQTNIAAGNAQQALGTARQAAGYTDANALLSVGNQQQQRADEILGLPLKGLQAQQSLAGGWQLPTTATYQNQSSSNTNSSGSATQAGGSPFGQIVGGGAAILGALDQNDAKKARGGPFYGSGGYVPTVTGVRNRNAMRGPQPGPMGGMGGMQPTGMPGMPPAAPPTAAALNPVPQPPQPMPHPANRRYAEGGSVFHGGPFNKATTGALTKLRLARGGGVHGYEEGGRLVNPQRAVPWNLGIDVGEGRLSGGAYYDPSERTIAVEGGYDYPIGKNFRLGVEGNYNKYIGPGGEHAQPEWGVGLRGRLRLARGGYAGGGETEVPRSGTFQFGPITPSVAHYAPFGPQGQAPQVQLPRADKDTSNPFKDIANLIKEGRKLWGSDEEAAPGDPQGSGTAGAYREEDFKPGGQYGDRMGAGWPPQFDEGGLNDVLQSTPVDIDPVEQEPAKLGALNMGALDTGSNDTFDLPSVAASQAQYSGFGPQAPAASAQLPSAGGGGGGGGGGSNPLGTIASAAMTFLPMIFSDERLKENIKRAGTTHNGLKVIDFNYKGSPFRQRGLSAQDVERKRPHAVGESQGYKTVNYAEALRRARGGSVPGFAGGSMFLDASEGYDGRRQEQAASDRWFSSNPPPAPEPMIPEMQARQNAEMMHERNKSGIRRWGEKVYNDVSPFIEQATGDLGKGEYMAAGAALSPLAFGFLDFLQGPTKVIPPRTASEMAKAAQRWRMERLANRAAKEGVFNRQVMGYE